MQPKRDKIAVFQPKIKGVQMHIYSMSIQELGGFSRLLHAILNPTYGFIRNYVCGNVFGIMCG